MVAQSEMMTRWTQLGAVRLILRVHSQRAANLVAGQDLGRAGKESTRIAYHFRSQICHICTPPLADNETMIPLTGQCI